MENYLCFRMNESFFLLPLAMVVWILPGNQNNLPEEWENEVVVRICCPEIGTQENSVYRILFQDGGACAEDVYKRQATRRSCAWQAESR